MSTSLLSRATSSSLVKRPKVVVGVVVVVTVRLRFVGG